MTATVFALCELTFAAGVPPSTGRTSQDDVTRCTSRAYANTPINSNADPMHFCMLGARACASPSQRPKGLENLALGISLVVRVRSPAQLCCDDHYRDPPVVSVCRRLRTRSHTRGITQDVPTSSSDVGDA